MGNERFTFYELLALKHAGKLKLKFMSKRKIFVIGDSISIHYGPFLKSFLEDDFEYDRKRGIEQALKDLDKPVGANGGDSSQVLEYFLEEQSKGTKYDLLLLNCGLHDIRTDVKSGKKQVDLATYKENLRKMCEISLGMAKMVIWIESTPVYDETHNSISLEIHRYKNDLVDYNQIAEEVMNANSIPIIFLHDFTNRYCPLAYYDHIHFKEEIRKLQAAYIKVELKKILGILPSRKELIAADYPYGKSAEGIPMGDTSIEWKRSNPDIILYKPAGNDSYDNDNEHFLVIKAPLSDELIATWTQSSCEGRGDNHLVIARSSDGINWSEPEYIIGIKPGTDEKQASWGFPVVSAKGRIYFFYTKEIDIFDNNRQGSGAMGCLYSDDNGYTWEKGTDIPMPRSIYDNPDLKYPKNWIVWQLPIRDSKGKYIVGYTLVTSHVLKPQPEMMWVNTDSRSYFMRFENIDENPEPENIEITWLPNNDAGLSSENRNIAGQSVCQEPSMVLLPDGRLFVVMRTMTGFICYSVSEDDGKTWREPEILRFKDNGEGVKHPLSPGPIYKMSNGKYFILYHNNEGEHLGFSQFKKSWELNEANFFRNPTYISTGTFMKDAYQPIWFSEPYKLFDTDDIAVGPKKTAEIATYTSYIEWNGKKILWYPDRKFYLLGKYIDEVI